MPLLIEKVRKNIDSAIHEISEAAVAAEREPESVSIMAVTKTHPAAYIEAAVACGLRHIGENRVSEGGRKIREVGSDFAVFHAIGVLHRKEVRQAVRDFHCIDAVHKVEIIDEIARRKASTPLLLEVNTSGESAKKGFPPDIDLIESALSRALDLGLTVNGFLTVGPLGSGPLKQRKAFSSLRIIRNTLSDRLDIPLPELSMGMSDDFALAVLEGATMVRLGRRLFGSREH